LSAAFDTIDHGILLERLSSWFGISGSALAWLSSFLGDRTFSVKVGESLSEPAPLLYGVPQGSVLGPILFNLYTTPLSTLISARSLDHELFADDNQMFTSFLLGNSSSAFSSIEDTFQEVSAWMSTNFLALNQSKTELLVF